MKIITKIGLSLFVACSMASTAIADEGEPMPMKTAPAKAPMKAEMKAPAPAAVADAGSVQSIEDAFKNGSVSGTIGSYFESRDREGGLGDYSWATGYLNLKYRTAKYKGLQFGAAFLAHTELAEDSDDAMNYYDVDIEKEYTVPEFFVSADFLESSKVVVGRFEHTKISHIDDTHTEGAYVEYNELEKVDLRLGVMHRFAELDYDDGEDFGRENGAQDLGTASVYGEDSEPYLLFFEGKITPCDMSTINPYIMYQDGYAAVYGIDAKIKKDMNGMTLGTKIGYQHVKADLAGFDDANNFSIFPFLKKGGLKVILGYAKFDDGNAMNRPTWVAETYSVMDQQVEYGAAGTDAYFAKVKYAWEKVWVHGAMAKKSYDFTAASGDEAIEYELQGGVQLTKACDFNLRLFDVQYDKVNGRDYQKVEARLRMKF